MEETLRHHLLLLADRFRGDDRSRAWLGKEILSDNTFFGRIERGDNFTVKTFDKVVGWFAANWPSDKPWPSEVARPQFEDAA